ncbi:chloride channel protein [Chamaesiphon sp.]|uniref:chloride channel protein n=1 Tax=Chamaesiphon sp. TaxID=2814140 RepID=UPI003593D989
MTIATGKILYNRLLQLLLRPKRLAALEACAIGLVAGLAAMALGESVSLLGGWRQQAARLVPAYIALPTIGLIAGVIAGWLAGYVAPGSSGSGMSEVKAVLARVPMPMTLRLAAVKWLSATLILAAGFPLGREGPTVQIGAALANQFSDWFPTSPERRRQLIAAGAGAGVAAAFNAPIAGVLFVVEELLQDVTGITLGTAILASFVASAVARIGGSRSWNLNFEAHLSNIIHNSFSVPEIPFYLLLGILAGGLGVLFNRGILLSLGFYRRFFHVALPWRVGLAGLVTGIALATLPTVFRDNAGLRHLLLSGEADWQLVAIVFWVKFALIIFVTGSGAPGGLLIPSMTLGSALGYLVGTLGHQVLLTGSPSTYAFVGMAAFFCAVSRVPITAVILVFEMTSDFNLVLPLMIGVVTANLVAEKLDAGSLYDRLLEANGIHLADTTRSPEPWAELTATQVMQRRVETIASDLTLDDALQVFSQSSHRTFPVMADGKLVGILSQQDMVNRLPPGTNERLLVADVMTPSPVTAIPEDTLAHILHLLDRYRLRSLPIVAGSKLVGIITRSDIIRIEAAYLNGKENPIGAKTATSHIIYQTRAPEIGRGRLLVLLSNPQTAKMLMQMAVAIARDRDYEIEVLHVIVVPPHRSLTEATVRTVTGERLLRQAKNLGLVWKVPVHTQIRVAHDICAAVLQTIDYQHINLALMGWRGSSRVPTEWIFSRLVDPVIQQANCELVLVKCNGRTQFDRWLVPLAGGPNVQLAIELLPALTTLSHKPLVSLCQVFDPADRQPDLSTLDRAADFLDPYLHGAITTVPIYTSSIPEAVLNYARQDGSDAIVLGASRAGILQQVVNGNIPAVISQNSDRTVIVVRGSRC